MVNIIYSIIIVSATFLGALVGLGGGVIIKPLLDLIEKDSVDIVNFISCCAVFSMSISSTVRHIIAKTKIDFKFIITLSAGAVSGGIAGSALFDYLLGIFDNEALKSIQGFILWLLLISSVLYVNIKNAKSFRLKNPIYIALAGLLLGFVASFLGVGGGPVNVAFLVLFFSMTMKEAAIYSVATIFFSQLSKLVTMAASHTIPEVSPLTLLLAIFCAVLGGLIGAKMNRRLDNKIIKIVFTIAVTAVAAVNFYNAVLIFI